mgnify:FL=1
MALLKKQRQECFTLGILLVGFLLTVQAAVLAVFAQHKDMVDFFFDGCNAARIAAANDVFQGFGLDELLLFHDFAVTDGVDGDIGVEIAQHIQVKVNHGFDFDDILMTVLTRTGVADEGNTAIELVKTGEVVNLHTSACFDVVDNDAVLDGINIQHNS